MLYIKELIIMLLLSFVIGGNLTDVVYDYRQGASLAHLAVEIALVIASMKASLVALFFMHLRWDKPMNAIILSKVITACQIRIGKSIVNKPRILVSPRP